ncbi:Chromosomal replication initiator protein DnaA [Bremerella volcania]|uniref:Chromosomal replication initiator protein DnaA n=1 Tax=Bremerella volcania TaxID=2527984 RepID=A0A518C6R2_9BACT|nr:DnaA/Hda family protein [Bremerella volcania]QDU74916.1 Chromosomal replication initiator protein DnaA [Bremerella volcania]
MVTEDIEILPALRLAMIERVGQDRFELWFGTNNTQLRLSDGCLLIESTSRVNLDFLRKNFHEAIRQALSDVQLPGHQVIYREGSAPAPKAPSPSAAKAEKKMPTAVSSTQPTRAPSSSSTMIQRRRFASLKDFVVSDCNSMAKTAATMVLQQPGQISPLYIHGPSGSGKTHLLEGIYGLAQQKKELGRVVYLSAEQFTTYFLEALQSSGVASFRRKYRDVGVLIIDDVQFFAGKRATKTELLHTLDAITRRGGQVVLAGNQRPTELSALGTELVARFSSGLICKVDPLDETCKTAMIQRLAEKRDVQLTESIAHWLTRQLPGEGRLVSGAINRLWAYCAVKGNTLSIPVLENLLADLIPQRSSMMRLDDVEQAVCRVFGVDTKLLRSQSKSRRASNPRMLAMWLARKHTGAALSDICLHFQRRSHSTVISAEKKVNQWLSDDSIVQIADRSLKAQEAIQLAEAELRSSR